MFYYLPLPWPQGIPTPALEHLNFNQILGISEKLELIFQPKVRSKVQTEMLFSLWESPSHTEEQKGYYIIQKTAR